MACLAMAWRRCIMSSQLHSESHANVRCTRKGTRAGPATRAARISFFDLEYSPIRGFPYQHQTAILLPACSQQRRNRLLCVEPLTVVWSRQKTAHPASGFTISGTALSRSLRRAAHPIPRSWQLRGTSAGGCWIGTATFGWAGYFFQQPQLGNRSYAPPANSQIDKPFVESKAK